MNHGRDSSAAQGRWSPCSAVTFLARVRNQLAHVLRRATCADTEGLLFSSLLLPRTHDTAAPTPWAPAGCPALPGRSCHQALRLGETPGQPQAARPLPLLLRPQLCIRSTQFPASLSPPTQAGRPPSPARTTAPASYSASLPSILASTFPPLRSKNDFSKSCVLTM